MSEIKKSDLISDEALKAPLILAENLMAVYNTIIKIQSVSSNALQGLEGADTIKKVKENTSQLTDQEKQLLKVQEQLSAALAKNNQEYADYQKVIKEVNQATKEKVALGGRDSLTINKTNASIKELEGALNKNRHAYAQLRTESQRTSKSGVELLKVIQQQDKEFKELRVSMGQNQDSVGDYSTVLRDMKKELKLAKGEMAALADTVGQSSPQYQEAAKRAGEIADKLGDAKDEAKAFQGDTAVENLGTRFGLLGDKVRSLDFKGASTQIQGISALSKQMTFKETIAGLGGFGKSLGQLAKAIFTNPLFLLAAIAVGISIAVYKLRDSLKPLQFIFAAIGSVLDGTIKMLKQFSDWMGISSFASEEATKKYIANLEARKKKTAEFYDLAIALAEAEGLKTVELEKTKLRQLIALNEKHMAKLRKQAQDTTAVTFMPVMGVNVPITVDIKGSQEAKDKLLEVEDATRQMRNELLILEVKNDKETENLLNERVKKEKDAIFNLKKFRLEQAIKQQEEIVQNEKVSFEKRREAAKVAEEKRAALVSLVRKKELADLREEFKTSTDEQLKIDKEYQNRKALILSQSSAKGLEDVRINREALNKIADSEIDKMADIQEAISNDINKSYEDRVNAAILAGELRVQTEQQVADKIIAIQKSVIGKEKEAQQKQLHDRETIFNSELDALNNKHKTGEISTAEYGRKRREIEEKHREESLMAEVNNLEDLKEIIKNNGGDISEIDSAISKARLAISEQDKETRIQHEQQVRDAVGKIGGELMATVGALFHANSERKIQGLQNELTAEEEAKNQRLKIAGDDAQAKAFIEAEFARKKIEIEKKIAAEKRKQAIFDKARAAAEVVTNTALGVIRAVQLSPLTFGLPWSAFIAGTGALQLARILATPIPQFAKGVENFSGGTAIIGERGKELVEIGSKTFLSPNSATVVDLPRGANVVPHDETMRRLATDALVYGASRGGSKNGSLEEVFVKVGNKIVDAVSGSSTDIWDDNGYRRYNRTQNGRVLRLDNRYKL